MWGLTPRTEKMKQKNTQDSQSESPEDSSNVLESSAPATQTIRAQARDPLDPAGLGTLTREQLIPEPSDQPFGRVGAFPHGTNAPSKSYDPFSTSAMYQSLPAYSDPQHPPFGSQSRLGQAAPTYSTIEGSSTGEHALYPAASLQQQSEVDPRPVTCSCLGPGTDFCEKQFTDSDQLRMHRNMEHLGYRCQFCDHIPFKETKGWREHMQKRHPREPLNMKPCDHYKCKRTKDPVHGHLPNRDTGEECENYDCGKPRYPVHQHKRYA